MCSLVMLRALTEQIEVRLYDELLCRTMLEDVVARLTFVTAQVEQALADHRKAGRDRQAGRIGLYRIRVAQMCLAWVREHVTEMGDEALFEQVSTVFQEVNGTIGLLVAGVSVPKRR